MWVTTGGWPAPPPRAMAADVLRLRRDIAPAYEIRDDLRAEACAERLRAEACAERLSAERLRAERLRAHVSGV